MEIEKRAFISNYDKIISILNQLGAKKSESIHIIDYWLCENKFNKFSEVQQHEPGSYGLRIRKNILTYSVNWELNCKILEKEGDHNAFHEFETQVIDGKATLKILKTLGFKIFCILDKKRDIYRLNNISINLENIENFKQAIELEIIADENVEEHKKKLDELLEKLQINEKDLINKSITYLYMNEFSFNKSHLDTVLK